jgi:hypothetical protein
LNRREPRLRCGRQRRRYDKIFSVTSSPVLGSTIKNLPVPPDPQFVETAIAPDFPIVEPPVRVKLDEDGQWFEIAHLGLLSRPDFITSRARLQPALRWSGRDELLSALELQ